MTGRYRLSPKAQEDLETIWAYTANRWGPDQAETYIRQIWHDVETIALLPAAGRACPEMRPGYYKYRTGYHVLFYRRAFDAVDIVRILHERMDFERHL